MKRAIAVLLLFGLAATGPTLTHAADPTYQEGVISHMGAGFGREYLALPIGRGATVEICGPAKCRVMTSNDFGPNQSVHPDRIADVGMETFRELCGCSPSQGLFRGSWRIVEDLPSLPETDTLTDTEEP